MDLKIIVYGTPEYREMVDLRYRILRQPIGLSFTELDLLKDKEDTLLAAYFPESSTLVGCCILSRISDSVVQLRQMAIDDFFQYKGVGSMLLGFAEQVASEQDYRYLYLHARKVALSFYLKHEYEIEGDQFEEVGIPHFEMMKKIKD